MGMPFTETYKVRYERIHLTFSFLPPACVRACATLPPPVEDPNDPKPLEVVVLDISGGSNNLQIGYEPDATAENDLQFDLPNGGYVFSVRNSAFAGCETSGLPFSIDCGKVQALWLESHISRGGAAENTDLTLAPLVD